MIVSNASALILLSKVNSLSGLLNDINNITIPKIVFNEIVNKKDSLLIFLNFYIIFV